jgi:PRTRC genetic system protein E
LQFIARAENEKHPNARRCVHCSEIRQMHTSLFSTLEQAMLPNESLRFTISRQPKGLVLLLQPVLHKSDEVVPKEAEQTRAVLAMPLRLSGSAADLDAAFAANLQGYGQARNELHDNYVSLLDALREASKDAKAKTQQAGKSTVAKPKGSTASGAPLVSTSSPPTENAATSARTPQASETKRPELSQPLSLL